MDKAAELARLFLAEGLGSVPIHNPSRPRVLAVSGYSLLLAKAWNEAEPPLRNALEIAGRTEPDDYRTFNIRTMLGEVPLAQGKLVEAEPLLLDGYEGLKKRDEKIHRDRTRLISEALDRLISFGEVTGRADQVAAWKTERSRLTPEAPKPETDKK